MTYVLWDGNHVEVLKKKTLEQAKEIAWNQLQDSVTAGDYRDGKMLEVGIYEYPKGGNPVEIVSYKVEN